MIKKKKKEEIYTWKSGEDKMANCAEKKIKSRRKMRQRREENK